MIAKWLHWLDNNILAVLAGFLLVFIPLYPKWPLFDILYGYNVRVRLEDFFVAATIVIFLLWILRRKIKLVFNAVSLGLIGYLVIGLLSVITAIFIIQTVPLQYLFAGKTFLHWLRRAEYFSLFFVFFASIRSMKALKIYLGLFFLTLLGVIIYGYGQKYLYWPAFSTMNREFAKGWWLYLTAHARVLSTFGGHYDLAGYLVIALTLCWSFLFGLKNKLAKLGIVLLLAGGFWLLILTASRISFAGYMLGLSVVIFLWTFKKGLGWGVSRWAAAAFLSILLMLSFGDLSSRFLTLFKFADRFSAVREILLRPAGNAPTQNATFLENNIAAVTTPSDQPPTPMKPSDVTGNEIPLLMPKKTASGATVLVPTQRTYSQNALMFDLSTGIRFDTTWPRAIAGFEMDPLLGKGYATLSQANKYDYTEGESTDNDYLRALGETGFLGFAAFFGTLLVMAWIAFRSLGGIRDPLLYSLVAGFIGLIGGLLVNATMIDIFESSKVAYVFWGVSGMTLGSLYLTREKIKTNMEPLRIEFSFKNFLARVKKFLLSDFLWVAVIAVVALSIRTYKINSPIADWHSWRQADTSAVTRDFLRNKTINWLYPTYDDLSSMASGKPNPLGIRFVEFPIYNAASLFVDRILADWTVEAAGRLTSALATAIGAVFIFLLCRRFLSRRIAYLAAGLFAVLPYNIYFGRTVLPDPSMVAASLGALWFASSYVFSQRKRYLVLALILAIVALLIKPYAAFLLIPLAYFWLVGFGLNWRQWAILGLFGIISLVPLLLWRWWMQQYPAGIPANDWLLNGDGIRFKGAFWYWIFADRIGREILGYWGLILLGLGLVRNTAGKYKYFPLVLFAGSLLYLTIFATGNVRHDYYQILIIPSLVILAAMGLDFLLSQNFRSKILAVITVLFMLAFGWYFIKDYYNINHPEIVEAGQRVRELTDWRAKVIAPYDGDTAFLYQTDRKGWPIMDGSLDKLINEGAQYYVSVNLDDQTKKIMADAWPVWEIKPVTNKKFYPYKLLAQTDKYVIIQLVPDSELPK
ncbi:glycosyltransferase family 39 protein [Patescibacteria group bacterium]|nr:glycosyltransferase family 39 protein [Patescibacteria group bacterium]